MKQNEFELLLNKSITDSSAFDLWKLPKVKDYINIQGENINQRTLERKLIIFNGWNAEALQVIKLMNLHCLQSK